jgi:CcmD family protein
MPALPLEEAGKYVAGAYVAVFALVLIYVAIMAIRLSHLQRELGELLDLVERAPARGGGEGALGAGAGVDPHDIGRPTASTLRAGAE